MFSLISSLFASPLNTPSTEISPGIIGLRYGDIRICILFFSKLHKLHNDLCQK